MKRKTLIIFVSALLVLVSVSAYPWAGETHKKITEQVEKQNKILQAFLKNMGFPKGEETNFPLSWDGPYYVPWELPLVRKHIEKDYGQGRALDWLLAGSVLEDGRYVTVKGEEIPINDRARHHFHDPTTLKGLRNIPFMWGNSARYRAFEDTSVNFRWSKVREYQYKALTSQTEQERNHYWALTLFGLGSVIHLLEDMSVPEHVRNDWVYGHLASRAISIWDRRFKYAYIEPYVKEIDVSAAVGSVCSLNGMISAPTVTFKKPEDLWDPNTTAPSSNANFGGDRTQWGLSQVTNYYFLSRVDQRKQRQRFPNPYHNPDSGLISKISHKIEPSFSISGEPPIRLFVCGNGPQGAEYAISELTLSHLLWAKLTGGKMEGMKKTYPYGFFLSEEVFRDYARILVPMMKGYAHRLMMLFLGLSFEIIELRITEPSSGNYQAEIEIKNKSDATILSGALFNTYYDDPETGERHPLFTTESGEGEELDYIIIDQDIEPDSTIFIQAPLSEKPATVCPLFSILIIYDATLTHEDCVGDCQTNAVIKGEINLVATKLKLLKPDGTDFAGLSGHWLIVTSYPDGEKLCEFGSSEWSGCCYYDSPQLKIYSSEISRLEYYYDNNCQGGSCPGSRNCGYFEDSSGNEFIQPQVGGDPIDMYGPPESPTPEMPCDCIYYTP